MSGRSDFVIYKIKREIGAPTTLADILEPDVNESKIIKPDQTATYTMEELEKLCEPEEETKEEAGAEEDIPIVFKDIIPVEQDTSDFVCGLIKDRHVEIPTDKYIFYKAFAKGFINDYNKQYKYAAEFFTSNNIASGRKVVCYISGLQCALATLMKLCTDRKVDLDLMHWNPETRQYQKQEVFRWGIEDSVIHPILRYAKEAGVQVGTYYRGYKYFPVNKDLTCIDISYLFTDADGVNEWRAISVFVEDAKLDTPFFSFSSASRRIPGAVKAEVKAKTVHFGEKISEKEIMKFTWNPDNI